MALQTQQRLYARLHVFLSYRFFMYYLSLLKTLKAVRNVCSGSCEEPVYRFERVRALPYAYAFGNDGSELIRTCSRCYERRRIIAGSFRVV